jgi:hypothetical protein
MSNHPAHQRVDLTQFESVEDAIKKMAAAEEYDEIAKHFLARKGIDPTALPVLFLSSMVNRCNSVHAAIAREMQAQNPHAVFPLIRAYSEGAALLIYVYDHVDYVKALVDRPREQQRSTPARLKVGREAQPPLSTLATSPYPKLVVSGGWSPIFETVCDVVEERLSC